MDLLVHSPLPGGVGVGDFLCFGFFLFHVSEVAMLLVLSFLPLTSPKGEASLLNYKLVPPSGG